MTRRIVAVLDSIRSLYNVGSMFRTADAFRVEHLYLAGLTGTPEDDLNRARIHKTALGAEDTMPWTKVDSLPTLVKRLRADGFTIIALEQTPTALSLFDLIPGVYTTKSSIVQRLVEADRIALIVGHELYGVAEPTLTGVDQTIQIPMLGQKESLNVAVAFGVAVSHLRWTAHE